MSFVGMAINLSLNVILMWPMGGAGTALATAVSSIVQCGLVLWLFQQRVGRLDWRALRRSCLQTGTATAAMTIVCLIALACCPTGHSWAARLCRVGAPLGASLATYFASLAPSAWTKSDSCSAGTAPHRDVGGPLCERFDSIRICKS